jgi:hypothetical protein
MLRIEIQAIPHASHRYETVGDYWDDEGGVHVRVSDVGNQDYEFLVAIHELIEQHLCRKRGIPEPEILAFDRAFEAERAAGKWTDEEPGCDPRAPYRKEHLFAEVVERLVAQELGIDFDTYETALACLDLKEGDDA